MILTTSPMISNPSTELVERVVETFTFVPGLIECKLIITCDGYKELSDEQFEIQKKFNRRKRGWISTSKVAKYKEYVENIR